jgi:hypothetical protein
VVLDLKGLLDQLVLRVFKDLLELLDLLVHPDQLLL